MVLEHRPMEPAAAMVRGDDVKPVGGFEGFDLDYNPAPSSRSVPDSPLDALTSGALATSRTLAPLSLFTVELSVAPPAVVHDDEVEEGEIMENGVDSKPPPVQAPIPSAQTPPSIVTPVATPTGSGSVDLRCGLTAFREKCRLKRAALLPRSAPRKPRKKRSPPSVVRMSARVAGRFASGGSNKLHQRILIH
jgi:hypothetical protein